MKSVFAPILLGALAATLAAPSAPAQPNPQHEHTRAAAQRASAEREAQRDQAQAQAERARARREARRDRAKQEARHDRVQRQERRDHDTSHEPTILLTNAIPARPAPQLAAIPAPVVAEEIGAHAAVQLAPEILVPRARAPLVVSASAGADLAAIRGDQLMREGEIAAARLLYEDAAAAGSAHAAVGLGRSYDPSVLSALGAQAVGGDALIAAIWYKRARLMGSHEADIPLEDLDIGPVR